MCIKDRRFFYESKTACSDWDCIRYLFVGRMDCFVAALCFPLQRNQHDFAVSLHSYGLLKVEHIREKTDFLLKNMAFFFIPSGVALMEQTELLKGKILPLLLICLLTTIITFAVSAFTIRLVMKWQNRWQQMRIESKKEGR